MEETSCNKTKCGAKKARFNLNLPKIEGASLGGDLNGCVLIIPKLFRINKDVTLCQTRLSDFHL